MLTHWIFILIFAFSLGFKASPIEVSDIAFQDAADSVALEAPQDFKTEFFPEAPYHVGDLISVRVTYNGSKEIHEKEIQVSLADQPDVVLGSTVFSRYTNQAELFWILDTSTFQPGFIRFDFHVKEMDLSWQKGVNLLPQPDDRKTKWTSHETNCCTIYTMTGSDAERDIIEIQNTLERTVDEVLTQFHPQGVPDQNPLVDGIKLVLIPAVVGHGGFASNMAVVTYSDRNWANDSFEMISHHEIVHVLDRKLNNEGPRPSLLSEGIAVYLSGGHYHLGDPLLRAAALLEMGYYIPLTDLADNFYQAQHEVAYMEGAALVAYLAERWGWADYLQFYFNLEEADSDLAIISQALEAREGITLSQLEKKFVAYLQTLSPTEQVFADVHLTIETYNMIRRYQQSLIPSAHFQTAWWPSVNQMFEQGITGDYKTREKSPLNVIIENKFIKIHEAFQVEAYPIIEEHLRAIDHYLDLVEENGSAPSHYDLGWPTHPQKIKFLRP